jgi:predicted amidophosphoribosyltransferase
MFAGRNFPIQSGPACARCGDTLDAPAHAADWKMRTFAGAAGWFRRRLCALWLMACTRPMKAAIHALKYDRLHPAAVVLGKMLAQAIAQLADEAPAEMLVVPIPLHRSKHAERGFNQARALAEACTGISAQVASGVAADTGREHADAAAGHGEPGGLSRCASAG